MNTGYPENRVGIHHRGHRGRREERHSEAPERPGHTPAAQALASNDRTLTAQAKATKGLDRMPRTLNIGIILMATAIISIGLTSKSQQVIARWQQRPRQTVEAISAGVEQALAETESFIKANKLSGQSAKVRSGALRQDLTHKKTDAFGGHVGTTARTAPYARTILGPGPTTIKPKNAKKLWIPIADNLTPSKLARMTPREAMSLKSPSGKRRLQIFTSKAGNLVAFLPDTDDDGNTTRFKRNTKAPRGGRKKGDTKGKLLFVLKDQVVIQGTDALAQGAREMQTRITIIFNTKLQKVGT